MMAKLILMVISLLAATVNESATQDSNECNQNSALLYRAVPGSCSKFQMCSFGELTTFTCDDGSVFHEPTGSCVPRGSNFDTCSISSRELRKPVCQSGSTGKMAHPQHCARYYDCSQPGMGQSWDDHEYECPYPELYNTQKETCEHSSLVNCSGRQEPLDPCEYKSNGCNGHARCVPCQIRFPSCRGMPDGMNEWKEKLNSPYYVICRNQRIVQTMKCPETAPIFDWHDKRCGLPQNI